MRRGVDIEDLREPFLPATWCLDHVTIDAGTLTAMGWAVRPGGEASFSINGRPFERESIATERVDLIPLLSHADDVSHCGFIAHASLRPSDRAGGQPIAINCVDPATRVPFRAEQVCYVPSDSFERWPLPDVARMKRVHGSADAENFRLVGYSNFHKLDRVLKRVTGHGFEGFARVLDWGCGCGRLLRHLTRVPGINLTGVDVDADGIAWCREHLPMARCATIPLHPPTALPEKYFDAVVGISIFTHLNEAVQLEWLEELRRVVRRGAVLLLTIHGPFATALGANTKLWEQVDERGFADGPGHDLDGAPFDESYYRNSYHSHDYIHRIWSHYFDVTEIVPACVGNMQDLVVLFAR